MTVIAPGTGIAVSANNAETLTLPIGSMKLFAEGPDTSGHFSVLPPPSTPASTAPALTTTRGHPSSSS